MGDASSGNSDEKGKQVLSDLQGILHPDVLDAPSINWAEVDVRCIRYLSHLDGKAPWFHHVTFIVVVLSTYVRLDPQTVYRYTAIHAARWRNIFPVYGLQSFSDWNPIDHLTRYLNDNSFPESSDVRRTLLRSYTTVAHHLQRYLRSLPIPEQTKYQPWAFPVFPADLHRQLSNAGVWQLEQQQRRKEETDALFPHFAKIRGMAHFRWNQVHRLQMKFIEAIALVESGKETLPLAFSYEEASLKQRLHFCLWDRVSFAEKHMSLYQNQSALRRDLGTETNTFSPEKKHFFLEFVHTEHLTEKTVDPDQLLWFGDLLRYDLLGSGPVKGTAEEIQQKQEYLRSWGYGKENSRVTQPFETNVSGLLRYAHGRESFLHYAQRGCKGLLFEVDTFFAAATFGLAALDVFTTTGARMQELLQIRLHPDCLYSLEIEEAQRFLMRLVPKGTDKPADYMVGLETIRNLEKIGNLLQDHYRLQPGENIPYVNFHATNSRRHQFPAAQPYLFQYNNRHLPDEAITACLRFLCHGMVFQTPDGRSVTIKAHSLRHIFAAHIHQVEEVPLDIVAEILHQKNLQVTGYYAAPPWQNVVASANSLLDRFATHLGSIEEAFVRAPAEMQQQLEEAKKTVGSLTKVPGGQCTCTAICPISFACTGCVYKIPDPDREDEIIEQEQWAFIRLEQVKKRKLGPEIVKMEALIQRCKTERDEMRLMRSYRKDEANAPTLTIEQRERDEHTLEQTETVVAQTLRSEAAANSHARQGRRRSTRQGEANGDD